MTLYRGLEVVSSDVSFGKAHEEEVGHDSFAMGSEVCGEVNVDDIAAYGLGKGLGSAEGSGYVPSPAND